ncbi:MAG TPA: SDR family oxidoreductase [Candidatus Dormibacteraeota bacterium]|nr:SDR family oxidoreductase [Candidatus Dormibacteraeota bacterium]
MTDETPGIPRQQQPYPGRTGGMTPTPRDEMADYRGTGLLDGRVALVTGGDSGIGRAVSVAFAKEGADVAIAYLCEDDDAERTAHLVEAEGRRAVLIRGDLGSEDACRTAVSRTVESLGHLEILVNNVAYQAPRPSLDEITTEQWERTFRTNIHSYFWMTREALPHLHDGDSIINTSSINGLRGNRSLIDYATTKGAVNAFTYSMAQALVDRRIRVNAVAPGPVWTPLIPSTMPEEKVEGFGEQVPMKEAAHPDDIAPSYVFLASERLSRFYTGEILAPVGGETMPG